MRKSARRRYAMALELAEFLLSTSRCCFCREPLANVDRMTLDVTLHHVNEDREPSCRLTLPATCGHVKKLAHRSCHRAHHMKKEHRRVRPAPPVDRAAAAAILADLEQLTAAP